jgi:transposase-like protein
MAEAVRIMLNEAMKIERSQVVGAYPYQRSERRQGYANGFKAKTVETRLGPLTLQVPQTRGVRFYPSALEKGVRSERALKLAQVRHETGENQAKPFRISLGSREVYTTFAVVFEAIRKAQWELMKQ